MIHLNVDSLSVPPAVKRLLLPLIQELSKESNSEQLANHATI